MRKPSPLFIAIFGFAVGVIILCVVSVVHAASLRICMDDASVAGAASVPAFAGSTQVNTDVLAGSTVVAGVRCSLTPIVASLPRNVDLPLTLKNVNALGEVSAASNAVPFRLPSAPTAPTGVTFSIVVP